MRCILMNKNVEVLTLSYDEELNEFDSIFKVNDERYLPYILSKEKFTSDLEFSISLSNWFNKRGILINKKNKDNYYLSLSDHYWLKPYESKIKYEDINYFDNDFEKVYYKNNILNGTDSNKFWIIQNGKRYFVKEVFENEMLEPFHEYLASQISKRLGFSYVPYNLGIYKNKLVSVCPCFIDKDKEYVESYQILKDIESKNNYETYKNYINLLEEKKVENAKEKVENMFIIDFLLMNEDRNLNNFGIIRDANTLKWIDASPIFDSSHSLAIQEYSQNGIVTSGYGIFFNGLERFDDIIQVVENPERIDVERLSGIVDEYYQTLIKYQKYTNVSLEKINIECFLLKRQIDKLKSLINTKMVKNVK